MGIAFLLNCDFLLNLGLMLRGLFFAVAILGFGGFLYFRSGCLGCAPRGLRGSLVALFLFAVFRLFTLCGVGARLVQKVKVTNSLGALMKARGVFCSPIPNTNISDSRRREARRVKSLSDETMQKASSRF